MTTVTRVGDYQSVDEKTHPQTISGPAWAPLRWISDSGSRVYALMVLKAGVQDVDYALRFVPRKGLTKFPSGTKVRVRIERYPRDAADKGTRWQGWFKIGGEEEFYITGHTMDLKGGKLGHGYGVSVQARGTVVVDQFLPKLDPRH